ncbi:MAG: hypothetical protein ACJZ86_00265 [Pontiellaceae bacterium]
MKLNIIKALILFTLSHNLYASSLNLNWTISLADYFNTNNYAALDDLEAYVISDEYIVVSASLEDTNSINTYYNNDNVLVTNGIENIGTYGPVLVINTNGTIVFSDEIFSTNRYTQFEQYPFTLPENNFLIISETYDYQSYGDVPITKSYVYSYSGDTQGELFTKEVFNFSIINVDRSSIIDHEGVLYGIDPVNLTFSQYSSNFYQENDNTEPADTNKYFLSEIVDLRVGSQTFGVSNGNAMIRMFVDESSDLTSSWSNTQHVLELDIPADADTKFYRFRMD